MNRSTTASRVVPTGLSGEATAGFLARQGQARCLLARLRDCSRQIAVLGAQSRCASPGSEADAVGETLVAFEADAARIRLDLSDWDAADPSALLTDFQVRMGKLEFRIAQLDEAAGRWAARNARPDQRRRSPVRERAAPQTVNKGDATTLAWPPCVPASGGM